MIFGEGKKGITMSVACTKHDPESLCRLLKTKNINQVYLFSNHANKRVKNKEEFLEFLYEKKNYVAKMFKSLDYSLLWSTKQTDFKNELRGIKRVFKMFSSGTSSYTTLKKLTYKDFSFVGMQVIFYDEEPMYVSFSKQCSYELGQHRFLTYKAFDKFMVQMLESLAIIQEHGYCHCDLKPDNIIYCKKEDRFKIIDWEICRKLSWSRNKRYFSNVYNNSPMAMYVFGIPSTVAINMFHAANISKRPDWYFSEEGSELVKVFRDNLDAQTDDRSLGYLFKKYKNNFDMLSLALIFSEMLFNNRLNHQRYMSFFKKMASLENDRFNSAKEALVAFRKL